MSETVDSKLQEVAARIRELREISGMSVAEAAALTEVSEAQYNRYEDGKEDLPFTFIHKCTRAFGVELSAITEGHSTKLSSYTVTRSGKGQVTAEAGPESSLHGSVNSVFLRFLLLRSLSRSCSTDARLQQHSILRSMLTSQIFCRE